MLSATASADKGNLKHRTSRLAVPDTLDGRLPLDDGTAVRDKIIGLWPQWLDLTERIESPRWSESERDVQRMLQLFDRLDALGVKFGERMRGLMEQVRNALAPAGASGCARRAVNSSDHATTATRSHHSNTSSSSAARGCATWPTSWTRAHGG